MRTVTAVLVNDTRVDCHHGCERVVQGVYELCEQSSISIVKTFPSHSVLLTNGSYVEAIDQCDLLLINGEGTMHGARPFAVELLKAGLYAKSMGKKVALINSCWMGNTQEMANVAASFDFVVVRDRESARELKAQGVDCCQSFDLSLYSPISVSAARGSQVGVSDSVLPGITRQLYRFAVSRKLNLISIQFPTTSTVHGSYRFMRDVVSFRNFRGSLVLPSILLSRYKLLINSTRATSEWVNRLAHYSLIVSGRFHLCTLAALTETPFVALNSNTTKIRNFIEDAGLDGRRVIDVEDLNGIDIAGYQYSSAELKALRQYILDGRLQYQSIFKEIYSAVVAQ